MMLLRRGSGEGGDGGVRDEEGEVKGGRRV